MADVKATERTGESNVAVIAIVLYLLFSIILSVMIGLDHAPRDIGVFKKSVLVIMSLLGGTPLGVIGGLLGDWLRKIACPDAFLSSGMIETLGKRLFWAIGPQSIGVLLGTGSGVAMAAWLFKKMFM